MMVPFWKALSLYHLHEYEECIDICNQLLINNPTLQGPWQIKMRSLTQRVFVDDIEAEEDAVTGSIDCLFSLSLSLFSFCLPNISSSHLSWHEAEKNLIAYIFLCFQHG
jgi:hypothetical protein